MFFAASKIVWALLAPLNFLLLLFLAGLVLMPFFRRAGQVIVAGAAALFILLGLFPVGQGLLAGLENRHPRTVSLPPTVDGIIVLGGVFESHLTAARATPVMNDGTERLLEGIRLAQLHPEALLLFSGGEGYLVPGGRPETEDIKSFIAEYRLLHPNRPVMFEGRSRNTYENAVFSREMVKPQPGQRWIVITSAFHMPRAMAVFAHAGWSGVIPWAVDYRTDGTVDILPRRFDVGGNFYKLDMALREYVGMLAYRLTGKTGGKPASGP